MNTCIVCKKETEEVGVKIKNKQYHLCYKCYCDLTMKLIFMNKEVWKEFTDEINKNYAQKD